MNNFTKLSQNSFNEPVEQDHHHNQYFSQKILQPMTPLTNENLEQDLHHQQMAESLQLDLQALQVTDMPGRNSVMVGDERTSRQRTSKKTDKDVIVSSYRKKRQSQKRSRSQSQKRSRSQSALDQTNNLVQKLTKQCKLTNPGSKKEEATRICPSRVAKNTEEGQLKQTTFQKRQEDLARREDEKQKQLLTQQRESRKSVCRQSVMSRVGLDFETDFDPMDPYKHIRVTENNVEKDVCCDVCLEKEGEEGDEIILCDLCNVAVHQTCYGSELLDGVPMGQWFCQRCKELKADFGKQCSTIRCFLCPDIDGAMKQVSCNGEEGIWAHIVCVNWNTDVWFGDDKKEKIMGGMLKERFSLTCNRCRRKEGACIQCDFKYCARSYHVKCLVRAGNIKSWEEMQKDLGDPDDDSSTPIFCQQHTKPGCDLYIKSGAKSLYKKQMKKVIREEDLIQVNKISTEEFNRAVEMAKTKPEPRNKIDEKVSAALKKVYKPKVAPKVAKKPIKSVLKVTKPIIKPTKAKAVPKITAKALTKGKTISAVKTIQLVRNTRSNTNLRSNKTHHKQSPQTLKRKRCSSKKSSFSQRSTKSTAKSSKSTKSASSTNTFSNNIDFFNMFQQMLNGCQQQQNQQQQQQIQPVQVQAQKPVRPANRRQKKFGNPDNVQMTDANAQSASNFMSILPQMPQLAQQQSYNGFQNYYPQYNQ